MVARTERTDVVLVGGGIMSATLGVFLKELEPTWNIILLERLDKVAQESSNPWNNAGTGHSALCELNYAPAGPDGTVSAAKALNINEQFQVSANSGFPGLEKNILTDTSFINPGPPHVPGLRRRPLQVPGCALRFFPQGEALRAYAVLQ